MLAGSELALDRAQIERSTNRKAAILAKGSLMGYRFIRLKLNNIRKRKVSGIDVLGAVEFTNDEMGGVRDYHLELRGGDIDFDYRPEYGLYMYDMVDTERNRQFLASHFEQKYWDIIDTSVQEDIQARYKRIKEDLLNKPPMPEQRQEAQKFWDEVHSNEERMRRIARGEEESPKTEAAPQFPTDLAPDQKQLSAALDVTVVAGKRGWPKGKPRPQSKFLAEERIALREKLKQRKTDPGIVPEAKVGEPAESLQFIPSEPSHAPGVGVNAP